MANETKKPRKLTHDELQALDEALIKFAAEWQKVEKQEKNIKGVIEQRKAEIKTLVDKGYSVQKIKEGLDSIGIVISLATLKVHVAAILAKIKAEELSGKEQGNDNGTADKEKVTNTEKTKKVAKNTKHKKPMAAVDGVKNKANKPQGDNDKNKGDAAKEQTKSGLFTPDEDSDFF